MKLFTLLVTAAVFLWGVVFGQNGQSEGVGEVKIESTVSEASESGEEKVVMPILNPTPKADPTPVAPPDEPIVGVDVHEGLVYPGAKVISSSNSFIQLESNGDSRKIVDWYKNKLQSMGMSSLSVASANANGKVESKLSGSNGELNIEVVINKDPGGPLVSIWVTMG